MTPISYFDAHNIPAIGSFSFILAGESNLIKSRITREFYYATGKRRPEPSHCLSFHWAPWEPFADRTYVPIDRTPWVRWDNEKGWVAK